MQDQDDNMTEALQAPQLSVIELRVLGALMEKQLTTPDQYPLTVNSIIAACNQKSSREPITNYQQGEVVRTLQGLEDRRCIRKEYGSRAEKYSQLFMQQLDLGKKHQAVLCVMMLRGPQSISELDTRTQRMEVFSDRDELVHCVERLCERELPYVAGLGYQQGQRGERFGHLFSGTPTTDHIQTGATSSSKLSQKSDDDKDTLTLLESEISELKKSVQELKSENMEMRHQLESLYQLTGNLLPSA